MSWRPLLHRMLRISTGVRRTRAPAPGPRGSSQEAPRGPGPDPTEEEAPVLDDEGLRALREELAGELARVAEREREATR